MVLQTKMLYKKVKGKKEPDWVRFLENLPIRFLWQETMKIDWLLQKDNRENLPKSTLPKIR